MLNNSQLPLFSPHLSFSLQILVLFLLLVFLPEILWSITEASLTLACVANSCSPHGQLAFKQYLLCVDASSYRDALCLLCTFDYWCCQCVFIWHQRSRTPFLSKAMLVIKFVWLIVLMGSWRGHQCILRAKLVVYLMSSSVDWWWTHLTPNPKVC